MKPRHQASSGAMELIKSFEGFRRTAAKLDDGRWTIGYGHTRTAREGVEITEKDAEALLIYDLLEVNAAVNGWTYTPLTQNQYDALVSFAFNIGLDNFRRSAVLKRINEGSMLPAASAMETWRKADFQGERIVVDALVRRRAAEKALFLTPPGGWVPAPSPVVPPQFDPTMGGVQPARRATTLIVPLDGASATAHVYEDETSATEHAAEAVTARLQALMPEEAHEAAAEHVIALGELPAPLDTPPMATNLHVEEVDFTVLPAELDLEASDAAEGEIIEPVETDEVFGAAESLVSGEAIAAPHLDPTEESQAAPYAANLAAAEVTPHVLHDDMDLSGAFAAFDEPAFKTGKMILLPYLVLGVAGMILFGGGLYWGAAAQSPYGWAAGLLGVVFIGLAVNYLLERLGGGAD